MPIIHIAMHSIHDYYNRENEMNDMDFAAELARLDGPNLLIAYRARHGGTNPNGMSRADMIEAIMKVAYPNNDYTITEKDPVLPRDYPEMSNWAFDTWTLTDEGFTDLCKEAQVLLEGEVISRQNKQVIWRRLIEEKFGKSSAQDFFESEEFAQVVRDTDMFEDEEAKKLKELAQLVRPSEYHLIFENGGGQYYRLDNRISGSRDEVKKALSVLAEYVDQFGVDGDPGEYEEPIGSYSIDRNALAESTHFSIEISFYGKPKWLAKTLNRHQQAI